MKTKTKIKTIIFYTLIVCFFGIIPIYAQIQTVNTAFNPNKLIEDKVFIDTQTFGGPHGIQSFLEKKNSVLANTNSDFLVKLKEPSVVMLKQGLDDPQPNLGRLRTAAELIWDASQQAGINPQVLLVTLNKEQGLITSWNNPNEVGLQRALDFALGFGCPDSTGCTQSIFPGFYFQLFGNFDASGNRYLGAAKSLMKSFNSDGGRGPLFNGNISKVGDQVTLENTIGGYENVQSEQNITLTNRATAALYRFTPHVFNGNYNFWKFFNTWFKFPNGTLIKLASGVDTYIIQNGMKQLVPSFVSQARNLNFSSTVIASPSEFDSYETEKPLGPVDNTVAQVIGQEKKYIFLENIRHPVSDLVLNQRGLANAPVMSVSDQDLSLFELGSVLPPKDGTIFKGTVSKTVYLVDGGKIKSFSAYTFGQRKITPKQIFMVPDNEISMYSQSGWVAPIDGSLIKAQHDNTIFYIQNGLKQQVTETIFKNRGFKAKQVVTISDDEMFSIPLGFYAEPKDITFFSIDSKNGPLFEFKQGTKHAISGFVAKQRGITPDYIFDSAIVSGWSDGIPVPPKDNSVIKGDKDATVYLVVKGQLRPMTSKAFSNRKIKAKQIVILNQQEVDSYGKGDALLK